MLNSRLPRLLLAGLLILLMLGTLITTAQESFSGTVLTLLNVRSNPNQQSTILAQIAENSTVTIEGRNTFGNWILVRSADGSVRGWVASRYVAFGGDDVLPAIPVVAESLDGPAPAQPAPAEIVDTGVTGTITTVLNVRSGPGTNNPVQTQVRPGTTVIIEGRNGGGDWILIYTSDQAIRGWVATAYVNLANGLDGVPVVGDIVQGTNDDEDVEPVSVMVLPPPEHEIISGINDNTRWIYERGLSMGNRPNVFSKVGDSLTDNIFMFSPIGWGHYHLHQYTDLQPIIGFFSEANARDGNSFTNGSFAARAAWTTSEIFNPGFADSGICLPGEAPLVCEYRVVKPSIALILIGTNDMTFLTPSQYRANLRTIVETSINMGVIPVLSTIPDRFDNDVSGFNNIIRSTARGYNVPLWDLWSALQPLPNRGRGEDDIHLSAPMNDAKQVVDFRPENFQYGYTMRNFTALQVLNALYREVIAP